MGFSEETDIEPEMACHSREKERNSQQRGGESERSLQDMGEETKSEEARRDIQQTHASKRKTERTQREWDNVKNY